MSMTRQPRSRRLGSLVVDTGDVVCFSSDSVLRIIEALGGKVEDYDAFIERFDGVRCGFHADGSYTVDQVTAVARSGATSAAVVIGGEGGQFQRLLREDEPTLEEFLSAHPRKEEMGTGKDFNSRVFRQLCDEYRRQRG
jgi:hypothetical protein